MDAERLRQIIQAAGYETRTYSGRWMSGKQCIGCVTDGGILSTLADIVGECEDTDDASRLIRSCRQDSMGKDMILYWPKAAVEADE